MRMLNNTLLVCFTALLFNCRKPAIIPMQLLPENTELKRGLPQNPKSINGYLFMKELHPLNSSNYNYFYGAFSDPKKNLLNGYNHYNGMVNTTTIEFSGNVNVGDLTFNSNTLISKTTLASILFYKNILAIPNSPPVTKATWSHEGNGSFKPIEITIENGYPLISTSYFPDTIARTTGFVFNPENVINNYDSIAIQIYNGGFSQLKTAGNSAILSFSPGELSDLFPADGYIYISGFNYFHCVINNKTYVFELSSQRSFLVHIN